MGWDRVISRAIGGFMRNSLFSTGVLLSFVAALFLITGVPVQADDAAMLRGRIAAAEVAKFKLTASKWRQFWSEELTLYRNASAFLGLSEPTNYTDRKWTLSEIFQDAEAKAKEIDLHLKAMKDGKRKTATVFHKGKPVTLTEAGLLKLKLQYVELLGMKLDFDSRYVDKTFDPFKKLSDDFVHANGRGVANAARIISPDDVYAQTPEAAARYQRFLRFRAKYQPIVRSGSGWRSIFLQSLVAGAAAVGGVSAASAATSPVYEISDSVMENPSENK